MSAGEPAVLEVFACESIRVYSDLSLKCREWGRKRPVSEQKVGEEYFAQGRYWRHRTRLIDHRNDYYFEKIVHRETGELVLLREGRLSEHRGYGSAKQ